MGAAAFLVLAGVCIHFGLLSREWLLMVVFAFLVPFWILIVRSSRGPVAFCLEPSRIALSFRVETRDVSRTLPWTAIQVVIRHGRNPTRFWLRPPLYPDQREREQWVKVPVGHVERFTSPVYQISVNADPWHRIEPSVRRCSSSHETWLEASASPAGPRGRSSEVPRGLGRISS